MRFLRLVIIALCALGSIQADASPFRAKRFRASIIAEPPVDAPPLLPGVYEGSVGSWPQTTQPADITNATSCAVPATYCRQVIADWDAVPYETITASRKIGVVAYIAPTSAQYGLGSTNPIDYVDIACDGGDWVRVEEPALNSDTGEIEYFVTVNPAVFADGLHECRFRAVPEEGRARVGQGATVDHYQPTYSLFINTNNGATLPTETRIVGPSGVDDAGCGDTLENACRQVWGARDALKASMGSDIGGGIICLMEGSYQWGKPSQNPNITSFPAATQFVTVQPCASQDKADVVFTTQEGTTSAGGTFQPRGWGIPKLRFKGLTTAVTVQGDSDYGSRSAASVPGQEIIWFDDVDCTAGSCLSGSKLKAGYSTNVTASNSGRPFTYLRLARNTHVVDATDDTYTGTKMVLTALIDSVDEGVFTENHPDIWQNSQTHIYNAIVRGLTCTADCGTAALFSDGNANVITNGLAWVDNDVNTISPNTQLAVAGNWKYVFILDSQFIRAGGMSLDAFLTADNFKDWNFTNTVCGDTDLNAVAAVAAEITIFGGTGCAP